MQAAITAVIEQHFEEAGFLFASFLNELQETTPDRNYLKSVNARLEAHLDGLMISLESAWTLCEASLEDAEPESLFVSAYLAFHSGDLERIKPVVEAGSATQEGLTAVSYGLAWHPWEKSGFWAEKFSQAQRSSIKSIGLFCYATYQQPAPIAPASVLDDALSAAEEHVALNLLQTAIKGNDLSLINSLKADMSDKSVLFQYRALETRILLGDSSAVLELKPLILLDVEPEDLATYAIVELATYTAFSRLDKDSAKLWAGELRAQPDADRLMLIAIGAMQERDLIPWVIKQMRIPKLARIAGKVYGQLCGIDLAEQGLTIDDTDLDEQWFEIEGDEELEWPDVDKISARHP